MTIDVFLRLRILIWAVILSLWGVMVYQYWGTTSAGQAVLSVANPFAGGQTAQNAPAAALPSGASGALAKVSAAWFKPADVSPHPLPPNAATPFDPDSSLSFVKPIPGGALARSEPFSFGEPKTAAAKVTAIAAGAKARPHGFYRVATAHFDVYMEDAPPAQKLLETLENLHANVMIELKPFVEQEGNARVSLYIFKNQNTYRDITGRPAWSGGATDVPEKKIYIYESRGFTGILAHEMCHIYYDGFYRGGKDDPLWLSEGMATYIQIERGLAAPNWLRPNLEILDEGGGYSFRNLMSIASTVNDTDSQVELWYTESYSVVRFLLKTGRKSNFYKFSSYLKQGQNVSQALTLAYGKPFTGTKALEYAWRYNLVRRQ